MSEEVEKKNHFIEDIIDEDLKNNKNDGKVVTRFPPEPNGYLHIGHAKSGKADVCSLTPEETRKYRGTLTEPGKNSPYRDRSIEENLELFEKMRSGEEEEGKHILRAKIDMASPNMNLRDPALYRVKKAHHHRTGDKWCIYPMYDYAHALSDSIEGITHSVCTLEFENHRPLYDWCIEALELKPHPQQIEFARLNVSYVLTSKRKLLRLVTEGIVSGWDDPRMPTIAGMRRRGYPAAAIRNLCERVGVAKRENVIEMALLEFCVREYLNEHAPRVMCVQDPLKVVITNYPEGKGEEIEAPYFPEDDSHGTRILPFSRELYIEKADFMEDAPKKFFRLAPGREVRLRYGYYITCTEVIKDDEGEIVELRCTYDPETRGGSSPDGRKVKGTLHWVCAQSAIPAEVRIYDHLFTTESPGDLSDEEFTNALNQDSLKVITGYLESSMSEAKACSNYQFERSGYYYVDPDSTKEKLIFNRTVTLKDTWAKLKKKGK